MQGDAEQEVLVRRSRGSKCSCAGCGCRRTSAQQPALHLRGALMTTSSSRDVSAMRALWREDGCTGFAPGLQHGGPSWHDRAGGWGSRTPSSARLDRPHIPASSPATHASTDWTPSIACADRLQTETARPAGAARFPTGAVTPSAASHLRAAFQAGAALSLSEPMASEGLPCSWPCSWLACAHECVSGTVQPGLCSRHCNTRRSCCLLWCM